MTEICRVEGCGLAARWNDAVRPDWTEIVEPDLDPVLGSKQLREWRENNRKLELHWEPHCDKHHRLFVALHGECALSQCIDQNLKQLLDDHAISAPQCPQVIVDIDTFGDDRGVISYE